MSYGRALAAAGACVIDMRYFGDYQGTWVAVIANKSNELHTVMGSFGSCSVCDAFQSEFNWPRYDDDDDEEYLAQLANFGRSYLAHSENLSDTLDRLARQLRQASDWEHEDIEEQINWLTGVRDGYSTRSNH